MRVTHRANLAAILAAGLLLAGCGENQPEPTAATNTTAGVRASAFASQYVVDFVSTAAGGVDMNSSGDVIGTSYPDPGCGPFCLPTQETVVWRGGSRIVLPSVPGLQGIYLSGINSQGAITGIGGIPGTTTHAAVWTPSGAGYTVQDLGALPGMSVTDAAGIDDQGRVVGWSSTGGAFPTAAAPYMWSAATGMVNLAAQGFPNDFPLAISPNGAVATSAGWYRLGNPASVTPNPAPPSGFFGISKYSVDINDNGDQARFLPTTSGQTLIYLFRLPNGGSWQMVSTSPTGNLSRGSVGSINSALDIVGTVTSTAIVAAGPSGLAQTLPPLISPAYGVTSVSGGGPMNASGQILASVYFGRSPRLVKLSPATACGANCLVATAALSAVFVQDPANPGSCFQGGTMYNQSTATVTVTDESGAPLANAQVNGRFMDDYWTSRAVTGTTNASGMVTWSNKGPCGVGAIEFLVEKATLGSRTFDRTRGTLARSVIPTIGPVNQPPVARWTVSCQPAPAHVCTFNGTGSSDPDGSIVGYKWTNTAGTTLSTLATFTRTFPSGGKRTWSLTVTDNGGATGKLTKTSTVP